MNIREEVEPDYLAQADSIRALPFLHQRIEATLKWLGESWLQVDDKCVIPGYLYDAIKEVLAEALDAAEAQR